jgi:hypothetical protein
LSFVLTPEEKERMDRFDDVVKELRDLWLVKNRDYNNSFEKSLIKRGESPFITRIEDKWLRIESLHYNKENKVEDESFQDTVRDMANYSIMYLMWQKLDKNKI